MPKGPPSNVTAGADWSGPVIAGLLRAVGAAAEATLAGFCWSEPFVGDVVSAFCPVDSTVCADRRSVADSTRAMTSHRTFEDCPVFSSDGLTTPRRRGDRVCSFEGISCLALIRVSSTSVRGRCGRPTPISAEALGLFRNFKKRVLSSPFSSKRSAIRKRIMNAVPSTQTAIMKIARAFADDNVAISCIRTLFFMSAVAGYRANKSTPLRRVSRNSRLVLVVLHPPIQALEEPWECALRSTSFIPHETA